MSGVPDIESGIMGRSITLQPGVIVKTASKDRSRTFEKLIDGVPTIIVADGRPLTERMRRCVWMSRT